MIDYDLVRAYYFAPPPRDPERVPSDEELLARYERRLVEDCILRMGDPEAEGLGPHGSMGGPGKPTTIHYCRAERTTPLSPLPLSWWDYPRARERPQPPGGQPAAHVYLVVFSHREAAVVWHVDGACRRHHGDDHWRGVLAVRVVLGRCGQGCRALRNSTSAARSGIGRASPCSTSFRLPRVVSAR